MKKIICLGIFFLTVFFTVKAQTNKDVETKGLSTQECSYNGIPLHGKVKVVSSFADFKVQIVTSFPDIDVKTVTAFPNNCGEWEFVDTFPDFTIQYVDAFPDIKIRFVEAFPSVK